MKTYISEDLIKGNPSELIRRITHEMATQLTNISCNDYEDTCYNTRLMTEVLEILFENVNNEYVELNYNPMGSWVLIENDEELDDIQKFAYLEDMTKKF